LRGTVGRPASPGWAMALEKNRSKEDEFIYLLNS